MKIFFFSTNDLQSFTNHNINAIETKKVQNNISNTSSSKAKGKWKKPRKKTKKSMWFFTVIANYDKQMV